MKSAHLKIAFNFGAFFFIVLAFDNYLTRDVFWLVIEDIYYPLGLTSMLCIVAGRALDILNEFYDEQPLGIEEVQALKEILKNKGAA